MAQLQSTDKFIVDRGGSTYKATFEDIEASLDLAYEYTGKVDATAGGRVDLFTITDGGKYFLLGNNIELFSDLAHSINAKIIDIDQEGKILDLEITDNTSGIIVNEVFTGYPLETVGSIKTIENKSGVDTGLPDGTTQIYPIYQGPYDLLVDEGLGAGPKPVPNPDYDGTPGGNNDSEGRPEYVQVYPSGGIAKITGVSGSDPTIEIVERGSSYRDTNDSDPTTDTYLERFNAGVLDDTYKVSIETADLNDIDDNPIVLRVDEVSDGATTDKILLTVQIGSDETTKQTVVIKPGYGINFRNVLDENNDIVDNEVEILSTILPGGGGGGGGGGADLVIVNPIPPTEPTYDITNGLLWYNTTNGRLYVALVYPAAGSPAGYSYDWIDASPSGLNDVVRKSGDTMTGALFMEDDNKISTTIYELERLPLISSL